jgi:hypothetical protein
MSQLVTNQLNRQWHNRRPHSSVHLSDARPTIGACPTANGCAAESSVPGANAPAVDFLRPYRGIGDIIQIQPTADADYNSLQTAWNRRFSHGLSFGLHYVLGKAMGTSSSDFPAGAVARAIHILKVRARTWGRVWL